MLEKAKKKSLLGIVQDTLNIIDSKLKYPKFIKRLANNRLKLIFEIIYNFYIGNVHLTPIFKKNLKKFKRELTLLSNKNISRDFKLKIILTPKARKLLKLIFASLNNILLK